MYLSGQWRWWRPSKASKMSREIFAYNNEWTAQVRGPWKIIWSNFSWQRDPTLSSTPSNHILKTSAMGSLSHPWGGCPSFHGNSYCLCEVVRYFFYSLTICLKCTSLWGVQVWIPLLSSLQSKYCFSAWISANKIEFWFHLGPIAVSVIQIITDTRLRFSEGVGKIGLRQ